MRTFSSDNDEIKEAIEVIYSMKTFIGFFRII